MKIQPTTYVVLVFLVLLVKSEDEVLKETTTSKTAEKEDDQLISSLNRIVNKVQSLKTRVEQVLNDTKAGATDDGDYFKSKGYSYKAGIGYHKLNQNKLNWRDALRFCRKESAHLAVIGSLAEANALGDMIKERSSDERSNIAFVGIRDQCKSGKWINIFFDDLEDAGYLRWAKESGKYQTNDPEAYCAAVDENGYLHGVDCNERRSFFCEIEL